MQHHTEATLHRARRRGARALVAVLAGVAMTAAWSSQIAGGSIGAGTAKTAPAAKPATPSPAAASGSAKSPARAASAGKH